MKEHDEHVTQESRRAEENVSLSIDELKLELFDCLFNNI